MGLVSVAVFMLVMPIFKATGGILLQMAPPSIPSSAMSKCSRQVIECVPVAKWYFRYTRHLGDTDGIRFLIHRNYMNVIDCCS